MRDSNFPSVSEQLSVEMVVKILMETSSSVAIAGNNLSHYPPSPYNAVRARPFGKLDLVLHHFVAHPNPSTLNDNGKKVCLRHFDS